MFIFKEQVVNGHPYGVILPFWAWKTERYKQFKKGATFVKIQRTNGLASFAGGLALSAGRLASSAGRMKPVRWQMKPVRQQMKPVLLVSFFLFLIFRFSQFFFFFAVEVLPSESALKPLFIRTFLWTTAFISLSPRIQEVYENALLHS